MCQCVVGLPNDNVVKIALPAPTQHHHLLAYARVVRVEDLQQLRLLCAGSM
jgi:hypothetical protein